MNKLLCFVLASTLAPWLTACTSPQENAAKQDGGSSTETLSETDEVKGAAVTEGSTDILQPTKPSSNITSKNNSDHISFTTVDRDGNKWTEEAFADQKLTMINFWEPWCGSCVEEMPDLSNLYEDYKEQGFLVLGVYGSDAMFREEKVAQTIETTGVTYPNLLFCEEFEGLLNDMYPITIFVNANGKICSKPIIGAKSYEEWEEIIQEML